MQSQWTPLDRYARVRILFKFRLPDDQTRRVYAPLQEIAARYTYGALQSQMAKVRLSLPTPR